MHSTDIKTVETKFMLTNIIKKNGCYQKPGYDKKNINADETARHDLWESVKNDDGKNGDSPQPVNIGPIG